MRIPGILLMLPLLFPAVCSAAPVVLDETPASPHEWGYRPADGTNSPTNPPGFSWRPQSGIASWELECTGHEPGETSELPKPPPPYRASGIEFNVHSPSRVLAPGEYTWRYRGITPDGEPTNWSQSRTFTLDAKSVEMPLPLREELLGRIPASHPRLFLRPEDLPRLKALARGPMKDRFEQMTAQCDRLLANPPPTAEPQKYPPGTDYKSEAWRITWWGNRTYTIAALDSAATLAFTRLLGGREEYGQLARRILLDCAKWDPKGATGYRYNDEAGMPYAYYFSRTYTFVHDLLDEEDRELCRRVMKIRGDEMYAHLCPRHLWRPYSSHSNRAWHFLGEVGVAFLGEIEGADDWVWFAMNVFQNTYPVWCDDDGGWHEGAAYWSSYVSRFTWWADVMLAAMDIDAYQKPYFSTAGYYPMYFMPPGKVGGGFGDLTARRTTASNRPLMSVLAAQAGNPYWQWYVDALGGPAPATGYLGFMRGTLPKVEAASPDDLPTSRLFRGTGQASLNTTLRDARDNVQVVFKSSPFGTQSHGYESNNSLLLWAYGQRLLVRSGYRDIYGSDHHKNWMWHTRSVNCITVDGQGQLPHSASAGGRIEAFQSTDEIDAVVGSAGGAYRVKFQSDDPESDNKPQPLDRFIRAILFVKPELIVVFDRLEAPREATFEYRLHATEPFDISDSDNISLRVDDVACPITFLAPEGLSLSQTDQYDPNPRERITLREWHLTAATQRKSRSVEFVTLFRPHRAERPMPTDAVLDRIEGGYVLSAAMSDGSVTALLPVEDSVTMSAKGLETTGAIVIRRFDKDGSVVRTLTIKGQRG